MYGKLLDRNRKLVETRLDDMLKAQRQAVDRIVHRYRQLGAVLLDPDVGDDELRVRLLSTVPEAQLREDQSDLVNWTRGDRKARFEQTVERHAGLSQFAGPFLSRMKFVDEQGEGTSPTLSALRAYREHRAAGRRGAPPHAPLDFAPAALQPLIRHDGVTDRRRWESALFLKVRDEIQTGNLAIDGAKNFGRFEAFFLPAARWEQVREAFWVRTGFPVDPAAAVEQLKARLSDAFDRFLEGVADNRQVAFDDDGWRLKTDAAEQPDPAQSDRLAELHRWLDARSRSIRLADLLIEVENDLGFSVHFQQPGEKRVDPGEVCALLAAILAHGCNLGLYTMEKVAPDIAYRRLKYVSDWRLVEENQRAALAAIVHGISRLDAAGHWGDGTTSASDGQRFAMPHKVLQRTYSTRFNDFALEFYSFVADNYAPFYSRPIECTDRDAPFVLDGVLYHESDLDLEEHYTDTHGYTEINFAAFGMVGMRFCPRIRSLHRQRIYCADPDRDHGVLEPVLKRGRRAVNFRLIAEQWDRIGQFYAAFPAGHATASAALQRLNRFQASNRFYAANRELGRALKTEFVLQYMSEPQLRAKGAAGPAQGRAAPRPGARRLLRAAGAHQRPRGLRPDERVLVPDLDSRLHRLLAGPGDLTAGHRAGLPGRPRSAAACQPDRVEERHPLRRDQDRPRQAHEATPLSVYHNTNGVGTLLEAIDTGTLAGRRDRALVSVMLYSFARVSAAIAMRRQDYFRQESRGWLRLHEKGGKRHDVPAHHRAAEALDDYLEAAGPARRRAALFQSVDPAGRRLTGRALSRRLVLAMIKRRSAAAGLPPSTCCHTFRATGITAYLSNGGTLEHAQRIAGHASPKTTKLYDRTADTVTVDEIERIVI